MHTTASAASQNRRCNMKERCATLRSESRRGAIPPAKKVKFAAKFTQTMFVASSSPAPFRVYNIGNNSPVKLEDFILAMEKALGKKAIREELPLQPGDVPDTWADSSDLEKDFGYKPSTTVEEGINKFITWYRDYYDD